MGDQQSNLVLNIAELSRSEATLHRPFADVLSEAVPSGRSLHKHGAGLRDALSLRYAGPACGEVDVVEAAAWVRSLPAKQQRAAYAAASGAVIRARLLDADFGSRIVAADLYAGAVWAARGERDRGAASVGLASVGLASGTAIAHVTGPRGGERTIAAQLKHALGKQQRIWITDTHLLFVTISRARFPGAPAVTATVPLSEVAGAKKSTRVHLLPRFAVQFTDGSRVAFLSRSNAIATLLAVLNDVRAAES